MKCTTISPSLSLVLSDASGTLPVASMTSRSFNFTARFNIYVVTRRVFIACKVEDGKLVDDREKIRKILNFASENVFSFGISHSSRKLCFHFRQTSGVFERLISLFL